MRYEVQHSTVCEGWVNTWTTIAEDGSETGTTYATREEAQAAIDEFFADVAEAVAEGNMEEGGDESDQYRIVEIP